MIRLSKSVVGTKESQAVKRVIEDVGYLGMGEKVREFEVAIEKYLESGDYKCVCVNTGTSALHLAVESVTVPGDEILVQSLTYVSSFQAIAAANCTPVACEVYPDTLTINLEDAEEKLTKRTKAIMPVHYASNPGNLDQIYAFAKKHKLRVIEDAAHAFGCTYKGKKIGSFGDIICFSFDGIKNITSGEGGAILTNDHSVLDKIKDARLLGVVKDSEKRYAGERSWDFDVYGRGFRYHMSNIFAAIGLVQLSRLENELGPKRKLLKELYVKELSNIKGIKMQMVYTNAEIIPHIMPIMIQNGKRNLIRKALLDEDIQVGIHYKPNHLLSYFNNGVKLEFTEKIYDELLTLPLHPDLSLKEVKYICNIIKKNI